MEIFSKYLAHIDHPSNRAKVEEVLAWVTKTFPDLKPKVAWNQPMFIHHDTFIIGFSVAKHHLAIAPERAGINRFADEIVQAGYDLSKELVRIRWEDPVDFALLKKMIEFNMVDKAQCQTFWRK